MIIGELTSTHLRRKIAVYPRDYRAHPMYLDDPAPAPDSEVVDNPRIMSLTGTLMRVVHEEGTDDEDLITSVYFFDCRSGLSLPPSTTCELLAEDAVVGAITQAGTDS